MRPTCPNGYLLVGGVRAGCEHSHWHSPRAGTDRRNGDWTAVPFSSLIFLTFDSHWITNYSYLGR